MTDQTDSDLADFYKDMGRNGAPAAKSATTPDPDVAALYADTGYTPPKLPKGQRELTEAQRDTVTRWGLDPRKFTGQTAPIESAEGLRDPQTGELIVSGRAPNAGNKGQEWGTAQAIANGALQGLGPKLQAGLESLRSDAPAGAYDQAKAHYEAQRGAFNEAHPYAGQGAEIGGAVVSGIPLMMAGGGALNAAGRAAADAVPALSRA